MLDLKVGMKIRKNKENWISNEFDSWRRGEGVGEVLEILEDNELDVRWPAGKCYESITQVSIDEMSYIKERVEEIKSISEEINNLDEYDDYNHIGLGSIKEEMIRLLKEDLSNVEAKELKYLKDIIIFLKDTDKTIDLLLPINSFKKLVEKSNLLPLDKGSREYNDLLKNLIEKYEKLYNIKDESQQDQLYIQEIEPILNVLKNNEDYLNKILEENLYNVNFDKKDIEKSNNEINIYN